MEEDEDFQQRTVQPDDENIDDATVAQLIVNATYSDIIIENCNDQEEEQLESFGDARPAEHRPFHRQTEGALALGNYIDDTWPNADRFGIEPMEIETANNHPYEQGGLDADIINDLIFAHDNIQFSTTVIIAHINGFNDNDEVESSSEIQEEPISDESITAINNEILSENQIPIADETVDTITMNDNSTNIAIPTTIRTEPEIIVEPPNDEPAANEVPNIPPVIEQVPTTSASSNEVHDERATTSEAETTMGAINLSVHLHGHHRSKSAEESRVDFLGHNTVISRPRSRSFMV